jgi:hypothetical protein
VRYPKSSSFDQQTKKIEEKIPALQIVNFDQTLGFSPAGFNGTLNSGKQFRVSRFTGKQESRDLNFEEKTIKA